MTTYDANKNEITLNARVTRADDYDTLHIARVISIDEGVGPEGEDRVVTTKFTAFSDDVSVLEEEPSGYVHCGCRDCMEILVGHEGDFCDECEEHGCEDDAECCAPGAYGMSEEELEADYVALNGPFCKCSGLRGCSCGLPVYRPFEER